MITARLKITRTDAVAFGALLRREQIGHNGLVRGPADIGECAHDDGNSDEHRQRRRETHAERAQRGEHQAENDHPFASHAVGEGRPGRSHEAGD